MNRPTEKQKNARLKNWAKGLLLGMVGMLRTIIRYKNISEPAKNHLKDASQLINKALKEWDKEAGKGL